MPIIPQGSPFYSFDRESVGWLLRQSEAGKPLTREDVTRVLKADSASASEPEMVAIILDALAGRLDRKAGRPPSVDINDPRFLIAEVLLEDRAREIAQERAANKTGERGRMEPRLEAAIEIGTLLGIQRGKSLLNIIDRRRAARKSA
ncbi:hypothetical protein [Sphingobium algorifonticola]|uniref:Uncharacterized protein n=1 Tax=Sphingobium algorifonticola TaxID=2008318 RepID=A0A437JDF1_9SPHN|nr:hypothetical protein [Sphingobium algorifonticola]RVT43945.1 hypothetical protein ENE74_05040 [Sphingobium algorifonticola]